MSLKKNINSLNDIRGAMIFEFFSPGIPIILKNAGLKIVDVEFNNINGGSLSLFISHKKSKYKANSKNIDRIIKEEKKFTSPDIDLKRPSSLIKFLVNE